LNASGVPQARAIAQLRRWLYNMRTLILTYLLCVFLVGCSDVVTRDYKTYNDAVSDELFGRGWLPEFIPSSSFNIKTSNNLDLNTSEGEFSFPPADTQAFVTKLHRYSDRKSPYVEHEKVVKKTIGQGYTPYEYTRDSWIWVFFLNADKGHAYYILWELWEERKSSQQGAGADRG
jgi:hypothetical protein